MKRSHEIASHRTSSSVLKASFLMSPIDNLICIHSKQVKLPLNKIGDNPSIGRGEKKGRDVISSLLQMQGRISIKLQLTGKSRLIIQFYPAFVYIQTSYET